MEVFAWRGFKKRREMGGISGLTPTPYTSSSMSREQGISRRVTGGYGRWRSKSPGCGCIISRTARVDEMVLGSVRNGRPAAGVGIVAVARKLLVALWRYLKDGTVPPGAVRVDWKGKMTGRPKPLEPATAA